jgi:hypothetical protein
MRASADGPWSLCALKSHDSFLRLDMSWTFEQSTGHLFDAAGNLTGTGYAGGNCGKNPEGRNNPALQGVPCVGPLPVGTYTLGTPVEGSHLGPFAIPLIPDPANDMLGRGDFYLHGDSVESPGDASEGCIIQSHTVRSSVYASADHTIIVISGLITTQEA